jgi:redox-sensing transcriptional repressor
VKSAKIPSIAITRLAVYARNLELLDQEGVEVISSARLADICGINSAQVRKDLTYFGIVGVRGVGYFVKELLFETRKIFGLDREWRLGLVGVGNLGWAILRHAQFMGHGYTFVVAFDGKPNRIGTRIGGIEVAPLEAMNSVVKEKGVEIGVIAMKPEFAQEVADMLVSAGVCGILNYAPAQIQCPAHVFVEGVDFSLKLDILRYKLTSARSRRHRTHRGSLRVRP